MFIKLGSPRQCLICNMLSLSDTPHVLYKALLIQVCVCVLHLVNTLQYVLQVPRNQAASSRHSALRSRWKLMDGGSGSVGPAVGAILSVFRLLRHTSQSATPDPSSPLPWWQPLQPVNSIKSTYPSVCVCSAFATWKKSTELDSSTRLAAYSDALRSGHLSFLWELCNNRQYKTMLLHLLECKQKLLLQIHVVLRLSPKNL